jgi:exosortase
MGRRAVPLLIVAGAATITYWDVGAGLVGQWTSDANYAHGPLVPPLAAYFAWRKRAALAACRVQPHIAGLALVVFSLGLLLAGVAASELFLARVSIVGVVAGSIWYLFGAAFVRLLVFPIAFLLLMVPLPAIVLNEIALPLQLVASTVGETVLRAGGVAVRRDGNVLELAAMQLEVAEACSGIRSLAMLVTFALALGRFYEYSARRMWALAIATVPVAVATNAARVAATGFAAHAWGAAVVDGIVHSAAGSAAFTAAVLLVLTLDRLFHPHAKLEAQ